MAKIGDTFFLVDKDVDQHLYVIISRPDLNPNQIIVANLTTWHILKDQSCILEKGVHEHVTHKTCIRYDSANMVFSLQQFEKLVSGGHLDLQPAVSENILLCILRGAAISKEIPLGNLEILREQGLVEDE